MTSALLPVLLVDVDGVIVTGRIPDGAHWSTGLAARFGITKTDLRAHFFAPFWADIVTGKDDLLPRLDDALQRLGSPVTAMALRDFWFAADARLNRPLLEWLAARRRLGQRIMLATNQDHSRADYLMNTLRLCDHCDGIYHSAALAVAKPDPAFFAAVADAENRPASELILMDDTPANVAAAQAAGWQAHLYTGGVPVGIS